MTNKIARVDYLRGLSMLAIVIIHVLAWHDVSVWTEYTQYQSLYKLRDILQFSVVTIIICSGFVLHKSYKNLELKPKTIGKFYFKRIKRLLIPWWAFLTIFFSIHLFIRSLFGIELIELSKKFILSSYFMLGGVGFGCLVMLMIVLTLLFPFINHLYKKHNKIALFASVIIIYLASTILFKIFPTDIFHPIFSKITILPFLFFIIQYVSGWTLVYLIGFMFEKIYLTEKPEIDQVKKEVQIGLGFLALYFIIKGVYKLIGWNTDFFMNKYPPSPLFIAFGLAITFVALIVFMGFSRTIKKIFIKPLSFLSSNSYWLFMWNALGISFINIVLTRIGIKNIGIKLTIDIILNFAIIILIMFTQKGVVKLKNKIIKKLFAKHQLDS